MAGRTRGRAAGSTYSCPGQPTCDHPRRSERHDQREPPRAVAGDVELEVLARGAGQPWTELQNTATQTFATVSSSSSAHSPVAIRSLRRLAITRTRITRPISDFTAIFALSTGTSSAWRTPTRARPATNAVPA